MARHSSRLVAGGRVGVGPVGRGGVGAGPDDGEKVEDGGQGGDGLAGGLGRDPAPGRQLVAGEAQGQDPVRTDGGADCGQHFTGEPQRSSP